MTLTWLTVVLLAASGVAAGTLGALVGIGGGIVMVPTLVLAFGFDIKVAVATSLLAVVATSTGAGATYVRSGLTNLRLGISLELATTVGAILGGVVAIMLSPGVIAGVFSVVMVVSAILVWRQQDQTPAVAAHPTGTATSSAFSGTYVDALSDQTVVYHPRRFYAGAGISAVAGVLSGLLGVGGGFLKVPAMTLGMDVPIKPAVATSNFMVGVTAIASLAVYLSQGLVRPLIAVPAALGIAAGATLGSRLASARVSARGVRGVLAVVMVAVAVQMGLQALGMNVGV
ncbi:MAG: sulfite exporter TauE/SafE family protein [Acidimicrobiia bacterium]